MICRAEATQESQLLTAALYRGGPKIFGDISYPNVNINEFEIQVVGLSGVHSSSLNYRVQLHGSPAVTRGTDV